MNYRILAKVLANRINFFLNNLISKKQFTFMANHIIHNNNLMAQEIIYSMHYSRSKNDYIHMKIDLKKAYDKLT